MFSAIKRVFSKKETPKNDTKKESKPDSYLIDPKIRGNITLIHEMMNLNKDFEDIWELRNVMNRIENFIHAENGFKIILTFNTTDYKISYTITYRAEYDVLHNVFNYTYKLDDSKPKARLKLIYNDTSSKEKVELFNAIVNYSQFDEITKKLIENTRFSYANGVRKPTPYWSDNTTNIGHHFEYEISTGENGVLYAVDVNSIANVIGPLFGEKW